MNQTRIYEQDTKQLYLDQITDLLNKEGEEVLRIGSGTIAVPVVFPDGEERYVKIVVSIPKIDFDGHLDAMDYEQNQAKKQEKKEAARKKKEEKMARDKAAREEKRKQKEARKQEAEV